MANDMPKLNAAEVLEAFLKERKIKIAVSPIVIKQVNITEEATVMSAEPQRLIVEWDTPKEDDNGTVN